MKRLISLLFVLPTLIFSQIDGTINGYIYDSKVNYRSWVLMLLLKEPIKELFLMKMDSLKFLKLNHSHIIYLLAILDINQKNIQYHNQK